MAINGIKTDTSQTTNINTSSINTVGKTQLNGSFKEVCESLKDFMSIGKKFVAKNLAFFYENKNRNVSSLMKHVTGIVKEKISDLKNSEIAENASTKISFLRSQTMGEVLSFSGVSLKELQECKEIRESFWKAWNSTEKDVHFIKRPQDKLKFLNAFQKELRNCASSESITEALNEIEQSKVNLKAIINFRGLVEGASKGGKPLARLVSEQFGGKTIETKNIDLTFGEKSYKLNVTHTPQKKMSGFGNDDSMLQCSSLHDKADHAKNLFKQSINIGGKSIDFLRFGCTRGVQEASKEVLANALALKYSEDEMMASTQEKPLSLKFSSTQLMTTGILGDRNKMFEQINGFKSLKEKQPIELIWQNRKVFVKLEEPVLFNFGVNWQHFILPHNKEDAVVNDINLNSFKHIFGNSFPNIDEENFDGEIKAFLKNPKVDSGDKEKVKILSKQIIEICKKFPKGIEGNPYALPCRVIVLTNLLGYASSYNCKSGKDRTGVCSIELPNLVGQLFIENKLSNPFEPIPENEKKNLQNIYFSGSAVEITKTNTGNVQNYLKVQESPAWHSVEDRFGFKVSTTIEQNRALLKHKI